MAGDLHVGGRREKLLGSTNAHAGSKSRGRVVRILTRLNVGGPARHVAWLTAGMTGAGFDSVLVAGIVPPGEDDMSYFAAAQGVRPLYLPSLGREISWSDVLSVWKLYRLFRRVQPDVVHTHTAKAGAVGRVAGLLYRWLTPTSLPGRPRRCRFVHTYHGHVFHSYYGPLKTRLFLTIERLLAALATDRIVVVSAQQYREIHETYRVGRAEQFAVVPLGLDLDPFDDRHRRRRVLRDELGARATDVLVGIAGRLTEVKNHRLFVEAAARFKQAYSTAAGPRVRFVIIGDGHLRDALERQARLANLGDDVTFLGLRDDPENFYPGLDVVGLTSHNEGTPLSIIEAMANSRAVISTGAGGVADLLGRVRRDGSGDQDGYQLCRRGVLVAPDDAEAFCRGLVRLVRDPALRRELGGRGRAFVRRHHSKDRLISDVENLYEELLQPRNGTIAGRREIHTTRPTGA